MENQTVPMQDSVMSMMNMQLEKLEMDLDDAWKQLGKIAQIRNKSQEEYETFFERRDRCDICEAQLNVMKKTMNRISDILGPQTPMLSTVKM